MKNTGALFIASLTVILLLQGCKGYKFYFSASDGMLPTINNKKNRLLVDSMSYQSKNPQRQDLIIYLPTKQLQKEGYQSPFAGRIIGLPGENVELKNGQIYINSQLLKEDYVMQKNTTLIDVCSGAGYKAYLSNEVKIPPDSYLILGDNRENSYDSRCWGTVPKNKIVGKIVRVFNF